MPLRRIFIPAPVTIKDDKGQPIGEPMTFGFMLNRLMENPKWSETYTNVVAQRAIREAFDKAVDSVMTISEEDWKLLRDAVEKPMTALVLPDGTARAVPGFGIFPAFVSQVLPLLACIVNAEE